MADCPFVPRHWKALTLLVLWFVSLPLWLRQDYMLLLLNITALNTLVVLGLNLLIGTAGQISLGHAAFYGMGAYLAAIAGTTWQWPLPAALLFALSAVAVTSFLLAVPTLRLEGHYLVMATLGFNIIVHILMNQLEPWTGGPSGFPGIAPIHLGPWLLEGDRDFYYFIWTVLVLLLAMNLNLMDSRLGRSFRAIHERQLTAQALGIPIHRYKILVFVLSAVYAGLAGFAYAHCTGFISPKTFDIFYSVQVVTMVVMGGMGSLWGGLAGAALLTCLPELLHHLEDLHVLFYGLILMVVLVFCPQGLVPAMGALVTSRAAAARQRRDAWRPEAADPPREGAESTFVELAEIFRPPGPQAQPALHRRSVPVLHVEGVAVAFGGLQALQGVDLEVAPGEITALIGPNGAGKTTLLNTICGLLHAEKGRILFQGQPINGLPPHEIAARGVGRTFQMVQAYHRFNVLENVMLGLHTQGRAGLGGALLHTPAERREEARLRARAMKLLDGFHLAAKARSPMQQLGLLEQKQVELARALALNPRMLLLDEPVSGLNPRESLVLMDCIALLRQQQLGIVVVEHDMDFVMQLADRVVVLQHGMRIAAGTPHDIQRDPRVLAAYLGTRPP
jgi:branched-chain amino acid transport system permease protein